MCVITNAPQITFNLLTNNMQTDTPTQTTLSSLKVQMYIETANGFCILSSKQMPDAQLVSPGIALLQAMSIYTSWSM